jgi:hypothetical protein
MRLWNISTANIPSFASFPWHCTHLTAVAPQSTIFSGHDPPPLHCTIALGAPWGGGGATAARPRPPRTPKKKLLPTPWLSCPTWRHCVGSLLAPHSSLGNSFARTNSREIQCSQCPPARGLKCIWEDRCGGIAVPCWGWDSYPSQPPLVSWHFLLPLPLPLPLVSGGVEKFGHFISWLFLRSSPRSWRLAAPRHSPLHGGGGEKIDSALLPLFSSPLHCRAQVPAQLSLATTIPSLATLSWSMASTRTLY